MLYFISFTALQIRAGHRSITANLWPLTAHIYHIMIIVTGGFSKKSFFAIIFWSSRTQMFFKTGAIRNFAKFTRKHLCWSLFLIKLQASLQLYFNLVPKETWAQVIPVKITIFTSSFFYGTPPVAAFVSLITYSSMLGICRSSLLNQKQNAWDGFY